MLCQPKIFSMHMGRDNDAREPFRTIHSCIRRERNLETGHDAISRSFTG